MNLRQVLQSLPADTMLKDGGTTAGMEYWLGAYDQDSFAQDAALSYDSNGKVRIELFDEHGYRISPPELVEA